MRRATILLVTICLISAVGCNLFDDDDPSSVAEPLQFENLPQADELTVAEAGTAVFRDATAWESFWNDHATSAPPAVDFDREMLLAVFWGEGPARLALPDAFESVVMRDDPTGARIEARIGPLPPQSAAQVLQYPVQIVRLGASDLPVNFLGEVP